LSLRHGRCELRRSTPGGSACRIVRNTVGATAMTNGLPSWLGQNVRAIDPIIVAAPGPSVWAGETCPSPGHATGKRAIRHRKQPTGPSRDPPAKSSGRIVCNDLLDPRASLQARSVKIVRQCSYRNGSRVCERATLRPAHSVLPATRRGQSPLSTGAGQVTAIDRCKAAGRAKRRSFVTGGQEFPWRRVALRGRTAVGREPACRFGFWQRHSRSPFGGLA